MKFWKLSTGAMTLRLEALVCAKTADDARKIAAVDNSLWAENWLTADAEEVTPKTGEVLLMSSWEDW